MFYLVVVGPLAQISDPGNVHLGRPPTCFRSGCKEKETRALEPAGRGGGGWVRNTVYCLPEVAKWC